MQYVETGESKQVELTKVWMGSQPGFKTYLPVFAAEDLIERKIAKFVADEKPKIQTKPKTTRRKTTKVKE